tara:strand:- start:1735 stop:2121 length:387 start_codon:yes stop_codon:yes gene_type:complete
LITIKLDLSFSKMEDVLINLRVISVLEPYQRLHTRQRHFRVYENHFLPEFFVRWLDGATRRSDFGRIRDVYTAALANVDHPGMRAQVQNSMKGLDALKKTYETDQTYLARVETLIEKVTLYGVLEQTE